MVYLNIFPTEKTFVSAKECEGSELRCAMCESHHKTYLNENPPCKSKKPSETH